MARTQATPDHHTSRQSVLHRSFERSHRFCLVAAPLERIAAAFTAAPLIRDEVLFQACRSVASMLRS